MRPTAQPTDHLLFTLIDSSLGRLLIARSARGLCAVLPGDEDGALESDLRARFPSAHIARSDAELADLAVAVVRHIDSPGDAPSIPLDLGGTAFQRTVWEALRAVPAGTTASYTDLAERIGRPQSVRAVAQACGANALAVVIPCHRAVRRDGGVSGYRWGVERKRALLKREGANQSLKM